MTPIIMVVEDDALMRRSLGRAVAAQGGEPAFADCITNALHRPAYVDGWLVDQGLPDGHGVDLVRELRSKQLSAPVLIVSGSLTLEVAQQAGLLLAPVHPKPVEATAVRALVAKARRTVAAERRLALDLRLTKNERPVVELRAAGVPRAGIRHALCISEDAVKCRIRNVLKKARDAGYACDSLDDLLLDAERRGRDL